MMRKLNKKKVSRRGAILVTVVFVLAFATIFIAAAMTLTQATRKRVYTEAESNQARLTVTSVAESWYRALQKCEFNDSALLALCKAGAGSSGTTIHVKASATADTVPGLETENTTSTTSFTTVTFYRTPNVSGATKDEQYTYVADFSTHIDGQVENVRAYLTYTPPTSTGGGKPFSTQIDLNAEFGQNNLEIVGDGKEKGDPDNIFLIRKGGKNTDSSFSSHSTLVYCDGDVAFKDEKIYSPDIVFLSGARLANKNDSTNYTGVNGGGVNLFFFGDSGESIAAGNDKGNFNSSGKTFYLCNRTNNTNWTSNGTVIYINADGSRADGGTDLGETFKKKVQKYASYNASYKKNGKDSYPTTDEFLGSSSKLGLKKTAPSDATSMSLKKFLTDYCYQKKHSGTDAGYVPAGTYRFTSDGFDYNQSPENNDGDHGYGAKVPFVMVLKGGAKYRFYFKSGVDFGLMHVVFIIDKPDPDEPVVFILEDQANLYWPGKPSGTTSNGKVGGNGIMAVEKRNFSSATAAYDYVIETYNKNLSGATNFENTSNKYSTRYDGKNEPCAMIIGMGRNTLGFDKSIIMEAFIGMFNESYGNTTKSKVGFRNGDSGVFYGRLMTDGLGFSGDSGSIVNPASPGSSTMGGKKPDIEKVVTCFALKSMIYYYNLGNKTTGG